MPKLFAAPTKDAVPVWFVTKETWPALRDKLPKRQQAFATACGFEPRPGTHALLPDTDGSLAAVLFGLPAEDARGRDPLLAGKLATLLPEGTYRMANEPPGGLSALELATLGWLLAAYRFTRYKKNTKPLPTLVAPKGYDIAYVKSMAAATAWARDLINAAVSTSGTSAKGMWMVIGTTRKVGPASIITILPRETPQRATAASWSSRPRSAA